MFWTEYLDFCLESAAKAAIPVTLSAVGTAKFVVSAPDVARRQGGQECGKWKRKRESPSVLEETIRNGSYCSADMTVCTYNIVETSGREAYEISGETARFVPLVGNSN